MSFNIPVFACKAEDGITSLTSVLRSVWEFWETICLKTGGQVCQDISFPLMNPTQTLSWDWDNKKWHEPHCRDFWYDAHHPGGFVAGHDIVGPHVFHIMNQLQNDVKRVALLGDSTTSYCTGPHSLDCKAEISERKKGVQEYLSAHGISPNNFPSVSYYAIPCRSLNCDPQGFVSQLSAILADHQVEPFDAILIVGGWNTRYLSQDTQNNFEGLLKGTPDYLEWWIPKGRPRYIEELSGYFQDKTYPQM